MSPLHGQNCKILYTDTDSLIYHIRCDDIYETMKHNIDRFDTSDYPIHNAYNMPRVTNPKLPFLFSLINLINNHLNTYILIIFLLSLLL